MDLALVVNQKVRWNALNHPLLIKLRAKIRSPVDKRHLHAIRCKVLYQGILFVDTDGYDFTGPRQDDG